MNNDNNYDKKINNINKKVNKIKEDLDNINYNIVVISILVSLFFRLVGWQ